MFLQLAMLTWCYFIVVFKDPGSVPENWRPVVEEENLEAGSSMTSAVHVAPEALTSTWSSDGLERKPIGYCIKCQNGKPPRCHHCSICKPNPIFNVAHAFLLCLYPSLCCFFFFGLKYCFPSLHLLRMFWVFTLLCCVWVEDLYAKFKPMTEFLKFLVWVHYAEKFQIHDGILARI